MKKLLVTLLIAILAFSCRTREEVLLQKNLMETSAQIVYMDCKLGFVTLRWNCANPPFKNQPCYKHQEFPIYLFDDPQLGDTLYITK